MPARTHPSVARLAAAPAVLLAACLGLIAQPPGPDAGKKAPDPPPKGPPTVRLFDGSFLRLDPSPADPERVLIAPQELQKLHDQVEQLRKQLAAKKPAAPSGCGVSARIEKRGETLTAAVQVTYSFHTSSPNAAVALGGKRAFPVSATLDGKKLPILDTVEDGFAASIETPGDHALVVEYEAAVVARGTKTEIGFEFGLPRAAITTLLLDPPAGVSRVNLTTRTPDPAQPPKPAAAVRTSVDVKQLARRPGAEAGPALGPVESVEVSWEPPAGAAPAEQVQTADLDVTCTLTDRGAETRATIRPRGTAREWLIAAPVTAEVTAAPAREPGAEVGPTQPAVVGTPPDAAKPVWKVELPAGSPAADWVISVRIRQDRAKPADPVAVGPLAVLGVARQTGKVHVTAAGSFRFEFQHGPDLRRGEPPAAVDTGTSDALFRLESGPTNKTAPGPLLTVRAHPVPGAIWVKPVYTLQLTEAGWQVEGRVHVTPLRAEVDSVTLEVPMNWRSFQVGPPNVVAGVEEVEGPRRTAVVKLVQNRRQPFTLSFAATSPVEPGAGEASVLLPRFPPVAQRDGRLDVTEAEATVTATVDAGNEVRGSGREWDRDQPAGWGRPLTPAPGPDGKPPKVTAAVTGRFEHGLARVDLAWQEHKPELVADVRAEVTIERRQLRVVQVVKLQPPRAGRFRGPPAGVEGLRSDPPLHPSGPGEWRGVNEAEPVSAFRIEYAVPIPRQGPGPWRVPVPLLWPAAATRTETVVRVWSDTDAVQIDGVRSEGWRDLPPEPAADRPTLPLATLAGTGSGLPLALDLRDPDGTGRASVWVGSGLIRVRADADRPTEYRARFRIRRWLADAAEVRVPGRDVQVSVDGVACPEAAAAADPDDPDGVIVRVPLPAQRPEPVELEVRYRRGATVAWGEALHPPRIERAVFDGPVRWQVALPPGSVPLLADGGTAEQRWLFRTGTVIPVPASSEVGLDRWFETGKDPGDGSPGQADELVVRQASPAAIRVTAVPRLGLLLGCSLAVLVVGLVASRLPGAVAGPVVALLGGAAAVAAVLYPQPAAQAAGAAQPGLAALVLTLGGLAVGRWYHRRRLTHLPGFAPLRTDRPLPPPAAPSSPSGRPRTVVSAGSTGSAAGPQPVET
jgi:hypothetical protein